MLLAYVAYSVMLIFVQLVQIDGANPRYSLEISCPPKAWSYYNLYPDVYSQIMVNSPIECDISLIGRTSLPGDLFVDCGNGNMPIYTNISSSSSPVAVNCTFDQISSNNTIWAVFQGAANRSANASYSLASINNSMVQYTDVGCYSDTNGSSIQASYWLDASSLSLLDCVHACANQNYSMYAGLSQSLRCFCGNTLASSKVNCLTSTALQIYQISYEQMYFSCMSVVAFKTSLVCFLRLTTYRFWYNVRVDWGDGNSTNLSGMSSYVDNIFSASYMYKKSGMFTVSFTWLDWNKDEFYACSGCPTLTQQVLVQRVTTNYDQSITLGSVFQIGVKVYQPGVISVNFGDNTRPITINSTFSSCTDLVPCQYQLNHTYTRPGTYIFELNDYNTNSFWNGTGIKTYFNTYSSQPVSVVNPPPLTNTADYEMTVTMPSCTSTDACISQIAVNYAFPVTVRLNSTNGFLNGSLVLFDLGDTFKYTYEIPVNPAENFTEIEIELNHTYTYLGFFNVNFTFLSSSENVFSTIVMIAQTFTSNMYGISARGCFTDDPANRTMGLEPYLIDTSGLTLDSCLANCSTMWYGLAGLENGNSCFCSPNYNLSRQTSDGLCNSPCSGDASQTCGGDQLVNIYSIKYSRLIILCSPSYLMVNDSIQCSFDYEFLIYWLKYTIDWGDGSQPDTWSGRLFNKKLSYYVNHTYTVSGNFSVKAIVLFDSSNYTRLTGSILVQKVTLNKSSDQILVDQELKLYIQADTIFNQSSALVDFGDGQDPVPIESTNRTCPCVFTLTHNYSLPGVYTIRVFDDFSEYARSSIEVNKFNCTPLVVNVDKPVNCQFQAALNNTEFSIDWSDGTNSTDLTHQFSRVGVYTVTLMTDKFNISETIICEQVSINDWPNLYISEKTFNFTIAVYLNHFDALNIDYGDASPPDSIPIDVSPINLTVSHTYPSSGVFVMKIYQSDAASPYLNESINVFSFSCEPISQVISIDEYVNCTFLFGAQVSQFAFSIYWDDGQYNNHIIENTSNMSVTHNYSSTGLYEINMEWSETNSSWLSDLIVQKIDILSITNYQQVNELVEIVLNVAVFDESMVIDWGDGSQVRQVFSSNESCPCNVSLTYAYSTPDRYKIAVLPDVGYIELASTRVQIYSMDCSPLSLKLGQSITCLYEFKRAQSRFKYLIDWNDGVNSSNLAAPDALYNISTFQINHTYSQVGYYQLYMYWKQQNVGKTFEVIVIENTIIDMACPPNFDRVSNDSTQFMQPRVMLNSPIMCEITVESLSNSSINGILMLSCQDNGQPEEFALSSSTSIAVFSYNCSYSQVGSNKITATFIGSLNSTINATYLIDSTDNPLITADEAGCFHDLNSDGSPIEAFYSYQDSSLTIESCIKNCSLQNNSLYAAVEDGDTCFCGNNLTEAATGNARCDLYCSGDASETCGSDDYMNVYSLSYEKIHLSCPKIYVVQSPVPCYFQLLSFRFFYTLMIDWGDGAAIQFYPSYSMDLNKITNYNHTYNQPGYYNISMTWVDWNPDEYYACQDCPTVVSNILIEKMVPNVRTISAQLTDLVSFYVDIYMPILASINYGDMTSIDLVNATNNSCSPATPCRFYFNHTYYKSGTFYAVVSDYRLQSYWNGTKTTKFYNSYALVKINVSSSNIRYSSDDFPLFVQLPLCSSGSFCQSRAAYYYYFPINVTINSTYELPYDGVLLVNYQDKTNQSVPLYSGNQTNLTQISLLLNHTYKDLGLYTINFTLYSESMGVVNTLTMVIYSVKLRLSSYSDYGCYATSNSTAGWTSSLGQNSSIEKCVAICDTFYAGLRKGNLCYCIRDIFYAVTDKYNCDAPCTGNSNQMCGGKSNTMSLFFLTWGAVDIICNPKYILLGDSITCSFEYSYDIFWLNSTIDWDDGSAPYETSYITFSFNINQRLSHVYTSPGNYYPSWRMSQDNKTWWGANRYTVLQVQNVSLIDWNAMASYNNTIYFQVYSPVDFAQDTVWINFGDGTGPISINNSNWTCPCTLSLNHTYMSTGDFSLSVYDDLFNYSMNNPVRVINFWCEPTSISVNDLVTCQIWSPEPIDYEIDWGDGTRSANLTHVYQTVGSFRVLLMSGINLYLIIECQQVVLYNWPELIMSNWNISYYLFASMTVSSSLMVDYGDGSSPYEIAFNPSLGSINRTMSHVYSSFGLYTMRVNDSIIESYMSKTVNVFSFQCDPSTNVTLLYQNVNCSFQFGAEVSEFEFVIDWGDGYLTNSTENSSSTRIEIYHNYTAIGSYNIFMSSGNVNSSIPMTVQKMNMYNWIHYIQTGQQLDYRLETDISYDSTIVISLKPYMPLYNLTLTKTQQCPCVFNRSIMFFLTGNYSLRVYDSLVDPYIVDWIQVYWVGCGPNYLISNSIVTCSYRLGGLLDHNFTYSIDWGDGDLNGSSLALSVITFNLTHNYTEPGVYNLSLLWDEANSSYFTRIKVQKIDLFNWPSVYAVNYSFGFVVQVAVLPENFTIDYGDGTIRNVSAAAAVGPTNLTLNYTYTTPGNYSIRVYGSNLTFYRDTIQVFGFVCSPASVLVNEQVNCSLQLRNPVAEFDFEVDWNDGSVFSYTNQSVFNPSSTLISHSFDNPNSYNITAIWTTNGITLTFNVLITLNKVHNWLSFVFANDRFSFLLELKLRPAGPIYIEFGDGSPKFYVNQTQNASVTYPSNFSISYTYPRSGRFEMNVFDTNKSVLSYKQIVQVISFNCSKPLVKLNESFSCLVVFDSSVNTSNYTISWGDSSADSASTSGLAISHNYSTPNVYNVTANWLQTNISYSVKVIAQQVRVFYWPNVAHAGEKFNITVQVSVSVGLVSIYFSSSVVKILNTTNRVCPCDFSFGVNYSSTGNYSMKINDSQVDSYLTRSIQIYKIQCAPLYVLFGQIVRCYYETGHAVQNFTYAMNWGDGSLDTNSISLSSGKFNFTHNFTKAGLFDTLFVWEQLNATDSITVAVQKIDLFNWPSVYAVNYSFGFVVQVAVLPENFTIDYGDGTIRNVSAAAAVGPTNLTLNYTYTSPGNYSIRVYGSNLTFYRDTIQVFGFVCSPASVLVNEQVNCSLQLRNPVAEFDFEVDWNDGSVFSYTNQSVFNPSSTLISHTFVSPSTHDLSLTWNRLSLVYSIRVLKNSIFDVSSLVAVDQKFSFLLGLELKPNDGSYVNFGDSSPRFYLNQTLGASTQFPYNLTVNYSYSNPGYYMITVYNGQELTSYRFISVLSFDCSPSFILVNQSVVCTFGLNESVTGFEYEIDWDNETSSDGNQVTDVSHTYSEAGVYNIVMTWLQGNWSFNSKVVVQSVTLIKWPSTWYVNQSFGYQVSIGLSTGLFSLNYGDNKSISLDTSNKVCPCDFLLNYTYYSPGPYFMFLSDSNLANYGNNKIQIYENIVFEISVASNVIDIMSQPDVDVSNCLTNCSSHGVCVYVNITYYGCDCFDGYTGASCQKNKRQCSSSPCLNGATCSDWVSNSSDYTFSCTCASYYTGFYCQQLTLSDMCSNYSCSSNGRCFANGSSGSVRPDCECFTGYTGEHCETASAYMKAVQITVTSSLVVAILFIVLLYGTLIACDLSNILYFNHLTIVEPKPVIQKHKYIN